MKEQIRIGLAFVGLIVGAGFATGLEVVQYFVSFGTAGLWGALIAGLVMAAAGAVILQLGSYFLAQEHNSVFHAVAHPVVSRILDLSVIATLFCIGFVMLAGGGSNLEQQFGLPAWIGSLILVTIVAVTGLLDVDRITNIISALTPLLIIAVAGAFVFTLFTLPGDLGELSELAASTESPVSPWWLSAVNYSGLALLTGVSMCLLIGGAHSSLKASGRGGLIGGIIYAVLLVMVTFTLLANFEAVEGSEVPTLSLYESIHPVLAFIMTFIIFVMVYSTAIGMFYSLGKRVTASRPKRYTPVFLGLCAAGYALSFVGFETLMTYVYPALGYLGMAVIALLIGWWLTSRTQLSEESRRREKLHDLAEQREDSDGEFSAEDQSGYEDALQESDAEAEELDALLQHEIAVENGDAGGEQAEGAEGSGDAAREPDTGKAPSA